MIQGLSKARDPSGSFSSSRKKKLLISGSGKEKEEVGLQFIKQDYLKALFEKQRSFP